MAEDVSQDGSVVVGHGTVAAGQEAFRWSAATGMVGLGDLTGGDTKSSGHAVSADGKVIVGYGSSNSGIEAFRWTDATGMVGLGDLLGLGYQSAAWGTSADGSVIVGYSFTGAEREPFLWTQSTGMLSLKDLLIEKGVPNVADWDLQVAVGISADGTTIVGHGYNPSGKLTGWIATVPEGDTLISAGLGATLIAAFYCLNRRRSGRS